MTESRSRPTTRTYVAIACGIIAGQLAHLFFGWDRDTMALVAGLGVAAILVLAMIRNKIRTGMYLPGLKKNQS
jgi:hypothetical protein